MDLTLRDKSVVYIDQLCTEWAEGKGTLLVVSGPVGFGKTSILKLVAERVALRGGRFFSVVASESERQRPLGLVDDLVRTMRAAGMANPGLVGERHLGWPHYVTTLSALSQALGDFAESRPIVIAVDDVHFADELSLRSLGYLIRRLEGRPIMVVLNESSCHERELATIHAETLHLPYSHRLVLAPLAADGIAKLLAERFGSDPARRTVEFFQRVSGGNPLLLQALIEDCWAQDSPLEAPQPGVWFRDAVLRCLRRCAPEMRAVARAVAMLGDSAEPQLIGRLLSVDVTAVRKSILDLRAAGLLAGGGFRHPAATQAVLADVPAEDRPGWHSRVAELLHEEGAPARIVADHLLAAYDVGTASWPVASLRQAASDAMAAGDALAAVRYLRHGAGVCADPAQRARLTALLADAQWQLDPGTAARYLPDLTEYVRTGLLTGAEASVPIRHLRWQGDVAQADALEEILVAGSGAATDGATRSRAVFAATAVTNWWAVLDPKLAVHDVSPQIGRYLGAPGERPAAVSVPPRPGAHLGAGEWPEIADQTLRGLAAGSFLPTMLVMYASTHLERPEPALRRLRRLLSENWVARIPMRRAVIETMTSAAALRFGDPDGAAVSARSALATVAPEAWGVTVGIPLSALIRAAVAAADIDGALSYLKIPVPAAMFDTPFALPYLQAAGRYYLAVGEPEAALARFRSCGELAVSWRFDVSALAEWRNDAAAALLAMGRTEQARTLLEEELARLDERPSRARGVALWRLAAAGDAVERPALLAEAVRTLEASGDRIESVSARADLTLALEASATSLSGTAGRFAGGLPTALRRRSPAQAEPRDADTDRWPADGLAELTHAERRVAELAAAGDSNREIALKLFITVSTVEQHLTKVYRKLNVSRRSSLPAVLRGGLG